MVDESAMIDALSNGRLGFAAAAAVGEKAIVPYPPLPFAGVPIAMERGRQHNYRTLADRLKAVDVVETEPLPPGHPLTSLKNIVVTPHVAGYSIVRGPATS